MEYLSHNSSFSSFVSLKYTRFLPGTKHLRWDEYINEVVNRVSSDTPIQSALEQSSLTSTQLRDLEPQYSKLTGSNGKATFQSVQGVDAKMLALSAYAENAVQQAASQFNFLESTSPSYMPLVKYAKDMTQGPQASIGALAALILRDYAVRNKKLGEQPLFAGLPAEAYCGGYLILTTMTGPERLRLFESINLNMGNLRILAQTSIPEFGSTPLTQVFTAAPSFQGEAMPVADSLDNAICVALVTAQYRAIAQLAVIQSIRTRKPVNLHLTLVGQGAFNNNEAVLRQALKAARESVEGFNVNVFIHGYSEDDIAKINRCAGSADLQKMTRTDFFRK